MGKIIIIKGADFSKNGMKSVNYVESIFCTTFQNGVNANRVPMVIAENINCEHTIKFEVELTNNATTFCIIAGWYDITDEGARTRLFLSKPYKANSAGEETFIINHQWGTGLAVEGKTDVTPGIHEFTFAEGVFIDGEKMSGDYSRKNVPLEKVSLCTGTTTNPVVSVKWRHIEIINPEGETIKDLYPALNEGKACLYDEISKSFIYGSEGYEWQYE